MTELNYSFQGFRVVHIIAKNTYREIIRDRILYGLLVFAVLLIGLSIVLGQLSYAEQTRITINFGFAAIHLCAAVLSIFVGSTLVGREIEKKTIITLLARPINRAQFVIGKSFGLIAVIAVVVAILALILTLILLSLNTHVDSVFLVGLYGILLEAAILLSFTIFFGSFTTPMLAVSFSIGVFLIGHWLNSLKYFANKSESLVFRNVAKVVEHTLPNLEHFNWRSLFVYNDPIPYHDVIYASGYGFAWCAFLTAISAIILQRRDLG
jgi:Cu-processing system permease protein